MLIDAVFALTGCDRDAVTTFIRRLYLAASDTSPALARRLGNLNLAPPCRLLQDNGG
jgi:hypothetical protein